MRTISVSVVTRQHPLSLYPGMVPHPTSLAPKSAPSPSTRPQPQPPATKPAQAKPPRRVVTLKDMVPPYHVGPRDVPAIVPDSVWQGRASEKPPSVFFQELQTLAELCLVMGHDAFSRFKRYGDWASERVFVVYSSEKSLATGLMVNHIQEKNGKILVTLTSTHPDLYAPIPHEESYPVLVFALPRDRVGDLPLTLKIRLR